MHALQSLRYFSKEQFPLEDGKTPSRISWIEDQEVTIHSLKSKLSSGRNVRLIDALAAASAQLKNAPPGNRHIVLVTDGGEFPVEEADLAQAMEQLYATQATVHIVSYTLLGRKAVNEQHPKIPVTVTAVHGRVSRRQPTSQFVQMLLRP